MKESNFSRNIANIAKAGAYYTDLEHCRRISKMFKWPDEEVCILEPSAGDGSAVKAVTKGCSNRKIFAVEIDGEAAEELKDDDELCAVLHADFFDCKISNKTFSFVFSNPPYIDGVDVGRMEVAFLKRITQYIKMGGILVYVIPLNVVLSEEFRKFFDDKYERLEVFRFLDEEFEIFHQVVVVARRIERQEKTKQFEEICVDDFKILPEEWDDDKKIIVNPSKESAIKLFTTISFDAKEAYRNMIRCNPQKKNVDNIGIKPYVESNLPQPPIMPNVNTMYLLSTLGCGSGKAGTPEKKDEHLQRGSAKPKEDTYEEVNENGDIEIVTRRTTKIMVTILEQSGKFTILE